MQIGLWFIGRAVQWNVTDQDSNPSVATFYGSFLEISGYTPMRMRGVCGLCTST